MSASEARRYRVSIDYGDGGFSAPTFHTSEFELAEEAYRLTKVPEGGHVELQQDDAAGRWVILATKAVQS